jgi:peptide/nickel transport system substrate-binding protein
MKERIIDMLRALSPRERTAVVIATAVFVLTAASRGALAISDHSTWVPVAAGSYREGVVGQPIAVNPVISANPADQDLATLLYAHLTDLATSIEPDSQFQIFTVKLAEDLTWDDGASLTSDDVVFTVKTIQDPDARSPLATSWRGVVAERVSELQVTFTLPSPYAFFKETLARFPIIPKHIFGTIPAANLRLSSYNLEPVGSGPYRFAGLDQGRDGFISEYRLVPNERFHGTPPFIQNFSFRFYENTEALMEAFRLRRVDGFGLSLPPSTGVPEGGSVVTERIPMPRYYAIFLNQLAKQSFKDDEFRQALSYAVDREHIVREVFGGEGTVATSPYLGEEIPIVPYDPEVAREHLSKSKVSDKGFTLAVPQIPALQRVAELVKSDWDAVGVAPVTITSAPADDFVDSVVQSRNYEALLFGNVLENPEDLYPFWHSAGRLAPGLNLALYQNAEVDQLLELNRETIDPEKRARNLARIAALIEKDDPAVFLFSLPYLYIHRENLQGFNPPLLITPADRFRDVAAWSVAQVRTIK